jgi:AraC family transcriptional activator of mtrCDE
MDRLLSSLEVDFLRLAVCHVTNGQSLSHSAEDGTGIHYTRSGAGKMRVSGGTPLVLAPHTLVITPRSKVQALEANAASQELVCFQGVFKASYGGSVSLFSRLPGPLVECFSPGDRLDVLLHSALEEMTMRHVGSAAMSAALLKQVLVIVLRRALSSANLWVENFTLLRDPRIARAFSEMLARPGASHSVDTLAVTCGMSRSAFTVSFTQALGEAPMTVLRQLRMRRAKVLLAGRTLSIDQVAGAVGYSSRSSFRRALRKAGVYASGGATSRLESESPQPLLRRPASLVE